MQLQIDRLETRIELIVEEKALVRIHLTYPNGDPLSNWALESPKDINGNTIVLDSDGRADVYIRGTVDPTTFSVKTYFDLSWSKTLICKVASITEIDEHVILHTTKFISTSTNVIFSPNVQKITYILVGGGDGGNGVIYVDSKYTPQVVLNTKSGDGGNGGKILKVTDVDVTPNTNYSISIGAGGSGGESSPGQQESVYTSHYGKPGGNTSFMGRTSANGVSANGGSGSYVTGNSGSAATVGSQSSIANYGGGGGGGGLEVAYNNSGGVTVQTKYYGAAGGQYGGNGSSPYWTSSEYPIGIMVSDGSTKGKNGTNGGGGGGAGFFWYRRNTTGDGYYSNGGGIGGNGGSGLVNISITSRYH